MLALIGLSASLGMISPFLLRGVLDKAIPNQGHDPARRARRRDDRDRDRDRRPRRRPDAALEHGRPARHARPSRSRLSPPAAALAGLLHPHAHRRDPVADRERHRRRAERRHLDRDLDRLQRDHRDRRGDRDVPARLAPGAGGARAAAVLRLADPPRWPGAAADHLGAPGPPRGHLGTDRGVALGLGDPARQDLRALAASWPSASSASRPTSPTSRCARGWPGAGGWRRCRSPSRRCRR